MGSSRTFSTPRERKKATAFMCFLQDSIEEFRKHFAINIPEEKKRQLEGWFLLFFLPQVEVYNILHHAEGTVWQWKEESFCKTGLKKSSCVGEVCAVEASCGAGPPEALGNQPKSQAGFIRA